MNICGRRDADGQVQIYAVNVGAVRKRRQETIGVQPCKGSGHRREELRAVQTGDDTQRRDAAVAPAAQARQISE